MEKKDQVVAKLHETIDSLSARVDRAEAKAKDLRADAKVRYDQAITNFKSRLRDLKGRARELEAAREDTWDAIKKSVEVGVEEFRREYRRARDERDLPELEALPPGGEDGAE